MESTVLKNDPSATRRVAGAESSKPRPGVQDRGFAALRPGHAAEGLMQRWTSFWFTPVDPTGLHSIRFLAGFLFAFWLLTFARQQQAVFSLAGWVDRTAYVEASRLEVPTGWSLLFLVPA